MTLDDLKKLNPCSDGLAFAESQPSLAEAWNKCQRPDWLMWIVGRVTDTPKSTYVRIACKCAKEVLPIWEAKYPTDDRPRKAVEAAEAWIMEPTKENRQRASAAYAYSAASYAAYAAYATANAAYSAHYTANAAHYAANANPIIRATLANIVRQEIPNPFRK